MTRADRTAAAAAQRSTFELLCSSFWDIVGEQIWNIYLVNIHCFLTQECHHKKHMCRRAGRAAPGCTRKSFYSAAAKLTLVGAFCVIVKSSFNLCLKLWWGSEHCRVTAAMLLVLVCSLLLGPALAAGDSRSVSVSNHNIWANGTFDEVFTILLILSGLKNLS